MKTFPGNSDINFCWMLEHEWIPWKFKFLSKHFFEKSQNRVKMDVWLLTFGSVHLLIGWRFNLVTKSLQVTMDEIEWQIRLVWNFHQRFQEIRRKFPLKPIQWFRGVSTRENSLNFTRDLIVDVFPEHKWVPWKFNRVPLRYWNAQANKLAYVEWLFKELGFKDMRDWYSLTYENVTTNGGASVLTFFNHSPYLLLRSVYPGLNSVDFLIRLEHDWAPWKFKMRINTDIIHDWWGVK